MKTLSLLVSIIIGICSIAFFRDRIIDIASSTSSYLQSIMSTTLFNTTENLPDNTTLNPVANVSVARKVRKVFQAIEQAEGQGARVRRSIGTPSLQNLSPFLMLDHFSIKPGAGFPDQYVLPCSAPFPNDNH